MKIEMTEAQAGIAVAILNSYAHQYLGLSFGEILTMGGCRAGKWVLLVSCRNSPVTEAADLDAAKQIIDGVYHGG